MIGSQETYPAAVRIVRDVQGAGHAAAL